LLHLLTRSITTRKRIRIASDLHFYLKRPGPHREHHVFFILTLTTINQLLHITHGDPIFIKLETAVSLVCVPFLASPSFLVLELQSRGRRLKLLHHL